MDPGDTDGSDGLSIAGAASLIKLALTIESLTTGQWGEATGDETHGMSLHVEHCCPGRLTDQPRKPVRYACTIHLAIF